MQQRALRQNPDLKLINQIARFVKTNACHIINNINAVISPYLDLAMHVYKDKMIPRQCCKTTCRIFTHCLQQSSLSWVLMPTTTVCRWKSTCNHWLRSFVFAVQDPVLPFRAGRNNLALFGPWVVGLYSDEAVICEAWILTLRIPRSFAPSQSIQKYSL